MTAQEEIDFKPAETRQDFKDAKDLFKQYAKSLPVDLSFQNFTNEMKEIHKQYNNPTGALLLAYLNEKAIGCVALRQFDNSIAELKRMYIQPEYRQLKIGKRFLKWAIDIAKNLHYKSIRLDTLPTMTEAQHLYRSFGFNEIQPYYFNPVKGTVFMEKKLN